MTANIGFVILLIVVSSAVAAWALVRMVENTAFMRAKLSNPKLTKKQYVLWWAPMLIIVALVVGFGVGVFGGAVAWEWEYGGLTGMVGGGLYSFVVSAAKGSIHDGLTKLFGKASKKPMDEEAEE